MIIRPALYPIVRLALVSGFLFIKISLLANQAIAAPGKILVLGDSISAAYGMSLDRGWVAIMAERLADEAPGVEVINASISGETTSGGLRRLPALLETHQPSLVVVELGGNDGLRGFPIPSLRENLKSIIEASKDNGSQVLVMPMEIPPNYGSRYTQAFRESFIVVTETTGAARGRFPHDNIATEPALMQADGIHPTVEAQPMIVDNVIDDIRQAMLQP
ncbi:MAG: arylesterase [Pseudomonadota bacterium]